MNNMTRTVELIVIHDYQRLNGHFMELVSKDFETVVQMAKSHMSTIPTEVSYILDEMWEEYVRRN